MKKAFSIIIAVIVLTSLSACMVVPVYDRPHYGRYSGHHYHHDRWGHRRWWTAQKSRCRSSSNARRRRTNSHTL